MKNWTYTFVKILLKRFKDSGATNRKKGSGRPRSVTTEENTNLIEELVCPQDEAVHTCLGPHKIAKQTGISRFSIRRMIKKETFVNSKRCHNRR